MTVTATPTVAEIITPPPALLRRLSGRYDGPDNLSDELRLAGALADADEALPDMYHRKPGNVLAVGIYHARALDIGVMTALTNLHFRRGRAGMSAALMHGLTLRAGHTIKIITVTDQIAKLHMIRGDDRPGGEVEWTMMEAVAAKLTVKDGGAWRDYPADALFARALSRGFRRFMGDVAQGFGYVPEELASIGDLEAADRGDQPSIDEDVQAFLGDVDLETVGSAELAELWKTARKAGLDGRHAGVFDGVEYSVESLLHFYATAAKEREATARAQAEAVVAAAEPTDVEVGRHAAAEESAAAPAGVGTLPCGCDANTVVMTGAHREGCDEATR